MTIDAWNWRGEAVPADRLLARYRMTILPAGPGPAWRVVALREVHGRAALRLTCRDGGRVDLDWRTSAGLVIPARTNPDGTADLPVNSDSYYRPADGPGPHRIQPAGNADAILGWGLALGLPDQPPAEIDNRYQTVAVTWAFGMASPEHSAPPVPVWQPAGSLRGFELPNRPDVTAEEWDRFDALPSTLAKVRPYHLTAATLAELSRRRAAVAVRPDSDGAFASDPAGTIAALRQAAATLRAAGIDRIYLIPDSEPNLGDVDPPAGYWDALALAERSLRPIGARLVSPPMAIAQGDDRWHAAGRDVLSRFDCTGSHAYGQQDSGLVTRGLRFDYGKPFFVAELGDSSEGLDPVARGAAVAGYLRLLDRTEAICLFILGTADPAWDRFVLPVAVVRTLAPKSGTAARPTNDEAARPTNDEADRPANDEADRPANDEADRPANDEADRPTGDESGTAARPTKTETHPTQPANGGSMTTASVTPIPDQYRALLATLCTQYNADEAVIAAMVDLESGWNPLAIGDNGHSVGLLQLHDQGLGAGMSVAMRQDPETNLRIGIRAHAAYRQEFGTLEAAIAAHNAGGPAVRRDGWRVVAGYVEKVLARAEQYRARSQADALRIQLDTIWGVSDQLLAGRADRQAWMLRQAVIAIKEMERIA